MPYTEILARTTPEFEKFVDLGDGVLVGLSPDTVATDEDNFTDWLGGYMLTRSLTPSRHDGQPATLITIADAMGQREVGRLVLRNDALLDARLELVRIWEDDNERDAWVAAQGARPAILDDTWEQVEARTVNPGDRIFVESDPDDPDLEDGTVRVVDVKFDVVYNEEGGRPIVMLVRDRDDASTFMPGEWSDHAPDGKVWVKRA